MTLDISSGCKTALWLALKKWWMCVHLCEHCILFLGIQVNMCTCREENEEKRERYFAHTFGVLLGLHPLLCSHAVASAGQPCSECVSHSIRCWEAVRFSALVYDILHLPREAGQPCHSNVKHMWNRPGQSGPTHTHIHRIQNKAGGNQNHTGLSHCSRV